MAKSLPISLAFDVAVTVTAEPVANKSTVNVTRAPTIGKAWNGIVITPRDSDGYVLSTDSSDDFDVALSKELPESKKVTATCERAWSAPDVHFACDVPDTDSMAGDWDISVALRGERMFEGVVRAQCDAGTYQRDGRCHACPKGSSCDHEGTVTSSLCVEPEWWRSHRESHVVLACPVGDACLGDSQCRAGHVGCVAPAAGCACP